MYRQRSKGDLLKAESSQLTGDTSEAHLSHLLEDREFKATNARFSGRGDEKAFFLGNCGRVQWWFINPFRLTWLYCPRMFHPSLRKKSKKSTGKKESCVKVQKKKVAFLRWENHNFFFFFFFCFNESTRIGGRDMKVWFMASEGATATPKKNLSLATHTKIKHAWAKKKMW